jgi:hypothetical protein
MTTATWVLRESTDEQRRRWREMRFPTLLNNTSNAGYSTHALDEDTGRYLLLGDHVSDSIVRCSGEEEWLHLFFDGRGFHKIRSTIFNRSDFFHTGVPGPGDSIGAPEHLSADVIEAMLVLADRR